MFQNSFEYFHPDLLIQIELLSLFHWDPLELDHSLVRRLLYCNATPQSKITSIIDRHLKLFNEGNGAFSNRIDIFRCLGYLF